MLKGSAHMAEYEDIREQFLRETPRFEGRLITVCERMVRLPNGREAQREIVYHKGAAAIVPVDAQGMVTLVRQYRTALETEMLEIPAGKLDTAAEDPLVCAHRELQEETGLSAEHMELLTPMYPTPGYDTEVVAIYLATGLSQHETHPDDDEFLRIERMPLTQAVDRVMHGELGDAKTAIGLLMAARKLCL